MSVIVATLVLALIVTAIYTARLRRRLSALGARQREIAAMHAATAEMHADMRAREARMADALEINRQKYTQQRSLVNRILSTPNLTPEMRANAKRVFGEAMDLLTLPTLSQDAAPSAPPDAPH